MGGRCGPQAGGTRVIVAPSARRAAWQVLLEGTVAMNSRLRLVSRGGREEFFHRDNILNC